MDEKILDAVFKAYDIRGRYPEELSPEFFYHLGRAYVTKFGAKKLVVGHDIRTESKKLKESLMEGIMASGCDVTDVGEVATEMIYFATGEYYQVYDGGLVVTASHNPRGWNGCKMVAKNAKPISKATGLFDLKEIMKSGDYVTAEKGKMSELDIYPAFKEKVLSFITSKKRKELDLIVDAGNGIGGKMFDYLFGDLGLKVKRMYFVPDGSFPNHVPNPMEEENIAELRENVLELTPDLGIAIDGDADRVFFIDKKGRRPDGVFTGVLLARHLLQHSENKKIIHDPRVIWPFVKECEKFGATTAQSIAGHSYFKQTLFEESALFGAEQSSHFYYRDFYNADSGMITIAIMLDMYYQGFELTEAVDYLFEQYPNSGEVNYKVEDKDAILQEVEEHYEKLGGKVSKIDGISVEFEDWRFNFRKSNTEPVIRLNLEATSKNLVKEKFLEVESFIDAERENLPSLAELR